MSKKSPVDKINDTEMPSFLSWVPTVTVLSFAILVGAEA